MVPPWTRSDATHRSGTLRARWTLTMAVSAVVVLAVPAGWLVAARGDAADPVGQNGPTAAVERRDLLTTLQAAGTLQRASVRTVTHAGTPVQAGNPTVASPGSGGSGDADGAAAAAAAAGAGPIELVVAADPTTSTTEPAASTTQPTSTTGPATSTTEPATEQPGPPPTSTTEQPWTTTTEPTTTTGPTTSTTEQPGTTTTEPATSTTEPTTSTTEQPGTTTTEPATSTTEQPGTTTTQPTTTGEPPAPTTTPLPVAPPGPLPGGPQASGGGARTSGSPAGPASDTGEQAEEVSAVLTGVLPVGAPVEPGTVLYTADDEPVVALVGGIPAWRSLTLGVDDGADVRQLEESLVALGYGAGLTVDESFDASTAEAVEAWETELGRAEPDGATEIGDIVYLSGTAVVLGHDADLGAGLGAGTPVLTLGSTQQVMTAELGADEAAGWRTGAAVTLEWSDGSIATGSVADVAGEVDDGTVEMTVTLDQPPTAARRSGSQVTIGTAGLERRDVAAVPVAAVVAGPGGEPAVRVPSADGPDELRPVETGIVAGGWIEIRSGIEVGDLVRLPG